MKEILLRLQIAGHLQYKRKMLLILDVSWNRTEVIILVVSLGLMTDTSFIRNSTNDWYHAQRIWRDMVIPGVQTDSRATSAAGTTTDAATSSTCDLTVLKELQTKNSQLQKDLDEARLIAGKNHVVVCELTALLGDVAQYIQDMQQGSQITPSTQQDVKRLCHVRPLPRPAWLTQYIPLTLPPKLYLDRQKLEQRDKIFPLNFTRFDLHHDHLLYDPPSCACPKNPTSEECSSCRARWLSAVQTPERPHPLYVGGGVFPDIYMSSTGK